MKQRTKNTLRINREAADRRYKLMRRAIWFLKSGNRKTDWYGQEMMRWRQRISYISQRLGI